MSKFQVGDHMTTATPTNRDQALSGLAARAERYGWTIVVGSFDSAFNLTFFRDLPTGQRELLHTRLSATGRITKAERTLGTSTRLDARDVFTHDKRTSVQLAMSA
jgi:hypothetical protein